MHITSCAVFLVLVVVSVSGQALFYLPHNKLYPQTVNCPDGITKCPARYRCCKVFDQYGCCPLPKPTGYVQILEERFSMFEEVKKKETARIKMDGSGGAVECPGGEEECPTGYTCCLQANNKYGCCPLPNAVCCKDNVHCCPPDYTCNLSDGSCVKQGISISMLRKQRARVIPKIMKAKTDELKVAKIVTAETDKLEVQKLLMAKTNELKFDSDCPGRKGFCLNGSTCCLSKLGHYSCCPLESATCCADKVHCCPQNFECNLKLGMCTKGDKNVQPLKKHVPRVDNKSVICDDDHKCLDGQTCCKTPDGSYGCCPKPNAVCCSDGIHCCPHDFKCDLAKGRCVQGKNAVSWFEKQPAVIIQKESSVMCPDGKSECQTGQTCCKLSSGAYGCCPRPNAVCCSDGVHCCPQGTTCDVSRGTCHQGNNVLEWIKKTPAHSIMKGELSGVMITCPDRKSACKPEYTCCMTSPGNFGCCPLPQAVCCSDRKHCCPKGSKCDSSSQKCIKSSSTDLIAISESATLLSEIQKMGSDVIVCPDGREACQSNSTCCMLQSGKYGCCPKPQAVCCSDKIHCCPHGSKCDLHAGKCLQGDKELTWFNKIPAVPVSNILAEKVGEVCPDQTSKCSDGQTCCKLNSGKYGCCPRPKAVCCSDGIHCCPNGYKCSSGKCKRGISEINWLEKLPALEVSMPTITCEDGSSCQSHQTCCKLKNGKYGCCPRPNAVCCSDGVHCCPEGTTCDVSQGKCNRGNHVTDWLEKLPASEVSMPTITCEDGSSCKSHQTCCKLKNGKYGCCPRPNAVCCSDGVHCCPEGTTCDVSQGKCNQGNQVTDWLEKLPALEVSMPTITCEDGSSCKSHQTCCKLKNGKYGCCPRPNAVCCNDGVHCCPEGTTCDVSKGTCNQGNQVTDWLTKLPAMLPLLSDVRCPDGKACESGQTCCQGMSGSYACCPRPNAVCCKDHIHCCPEGYTCDVSEGNCKKGNSVMALLEKILPNNGQNLERDNICPDGVSRCQTGQTCCKTQTGYGCCPLTKAVCCEDGLHCCPESFKCDNTTQKCHLGPVRFKWENLINRASVICPDGRSDCMDGQTCCLLINGQYGCCPFPDAVCCSDHVHCCRQGEQCNLVYKRCEGIDGKHTQMLKKLPALPYYSPKLNCPDGKAECSNNNTCCKTSTGQYGCCAYEKAVCCPDGKYCCPHGYICDTQPMICRQPDMAKSTNQILQLLGKKLGKPIN